MKYYKKEFCVVIIYYCAVATVDAFTKSLLSAVPDLVHDVTHGARSGLHKTSNKLRDHVDNIWNVKRNPFSKKGRKSHIIFDGVQDISDTIKNVPNRLENEIREKTKILKDAKFILPNIVSGIIDPVIKSLVYNSTEFIVHTNQRSDGETFSFDNSTNANIDIGRTTKVLIHGWNNDRTSSMPQTLKDLYMANGDFNVIVVDWGALSKILIYPLPANGTDIVGACIAEFLMNLYADTGDKYLNVHLVGHSLGAHVSGFTGRRLLQFGYMVHRITGLDPANPLMYKGLSKDDAHFVDIIHTSSGLLGKSNPLGHVDFYPNGGTVPQPGCLAFLTEPLSCSHSRSWEYFGKSIENPTRYLASRCDQSQSTTDNGESAYMGEGVLEDSRGNFCLETGDS